MGTFTLALVIGMAISAFFSVIWAVRALMGIARIGRNPDGSVFMFIPTLVGFFILFTGVFFVISLIPISIIKAIG